MLTGNKKPPELRVVSFSVGENLFSRVPGRLQPSIFSAGELNFRVRDGNGWTLAAINTNYLIFCRLSRQLHNDITDF